jgi:transposase
VETDPIRVCELIVGLPNVNVLGVEDLGVGRPLRLHIETRGSRPVCRECGASAEVKDRPAVELVDLSAFGRPVRTVWRKHRWRCPDPTCPVGSWTGVDARIASPRLGLTDRAGRWVTEQVGKCGRTVSEVARELGCDWHTVNDAALAYGEELLEADTERIGQVTALGMDETLFARVGLWRRQLWSTSIVDVAHGVLLDVVPGRGGAEPAAWLAAQGDDWLSQVEWATLDLSGGVESFV